MARSSKPSVRLREQAQVGSIPTRLRQIRHSSIHETTRPSRNNQVRVRLCDFVDRSLKISRSVFTLTRRLPLLDPPRFDSLTFRDSNERSNGYTKKQKKARPATSVGR